MFQKAGVNPASGLFSWGHLILLFIFLTLAVLFYRYTRKWDKPKVMSFFKVYSLVILALEIFKIIWNIVNYGFDVTALNRFIPLYYCSIFIFAFILLSWSKGRIAKASYAWMIYGGLIAGVCFLAYPSSSLLEYPAYHFLSIHSILFHTSLVVIGLMILRHKMYEPSPKDFYYFFYFSLVFMFAAFVVNKFTGTNMMFLEVPLAIRPLSWLHTKSPIVFEFFMFYAQLFLPFVFTHWIFILLTKYTKKIIYSNTTN